MNLKGMIVSIVTAMLVMTMFASSAMAITVDGRIDPSDEWDASWKLADDLNDEPPLPLPNGYNISAIWQHYDAAENGKLYIRYSTIGIAGDTTGNGIPHPPPDYIEGWGVGPDEKYVVGFDVDNNAATGVAMMGYPAFFDGFDLIITYADNTVSAIWYGITAPPGFVAEAMIATDEPYTQVVEFSINNVDEFMDWHHYRLYGFAGSLHDTGNPEDPLTEPIEVLEFDFNWTGICCHNMSFTGTSCGTIVSHTWNFGDGTPPVTISGPPVSPIWHQYTRGDLPKFNVTLSGCNALGACASVSHWVYVDKGPTAKATRTPGVVYANTPTSVKFDGSASHADPSGDPLRTITHEWSFSDGTYDSGPIVYKDVTLGPGATLSATLTVNDSHCEDDVTVYVTTKPPQEVPLLTLPGLLALIGMMCIVGAGRILTKGRRS